MNAPATLLSVKIDTSYRDKAVLSGLSLEMQPGEIVGLVGHSGSGKSTLALAILRLLDRKGGTVSGSVKLAGRELMEMSEAELRRLRGGAIACVPQSAISSLNPALNIGTQMREAWGAHGKGTRQQRETRIREVLRAVALPEVEEILERKSSQLSVGQGQRVLIAMAILHSPSLLIADEPTSALDTITQSEVLELLARLNRELHVAVLYISHDLLAVSSFCHRVAILHEGRIVESGQARTIFAAPQHPFTRQLVRAIPNLPNETK